jgi:hypothetical protein
MAPDEQGDSAEEDEFWRVEELSASQEEQHDSCLETVVTGFFAVAIILVAIFVFYLINC